MSLYYEAHVTTEPVFEDRLEEFKKLCKIYNFRVADLLMQKRPEDSPERSKHDAFCTGRDRSYDNLLLRTLNLVELLDYNKFEVWRYKIEDTLLDSNIDDSTHKLTRSNPKMSAKRNTETPFLAILENQ